MAINPKSLENLEKGKGYFSRDNNEIARKCGKKGGTNKGKAYAERANAQTIVNAILASPVIDDEAKANLEKLGLPKTMFWKVLLGAVQNSENKPDLLRHILELTGDITKDKSNVTVNAVPIIFGGENELK